MMPARTTAAAALVALGGAAVIGAALVFQYGFGYQPCPLCLLQRWPYYIGVPIAILVALAAAANPGSPAARLGLVLLALIFLVSAGLGTFHAGVEWTWWPGPTTCQTGSVADIKGFGQGGLAGVRLAACDEAAWRLFGLSMAGWNALSSLGLAAVALFGAARRRAA